MPGATDQWFGTLPVWIQVAASFGVFLVAVAAGAFGFMRNLKSKTASGTPKVVVEPTSVTDARPLLTLIEEAKKMNDTFARIEQGIHTIASIIDAEHRQEEFERAVKAEVERRKSAG